MEGQPPTAQGAQPRPPTRAEDASAAFRSFFQPPRGDTHPAAPAVRPPPSSSPPDPDDIVAAMQRTNEVVAKGGGGASPGWDGRGGTAIAEVRGDTLPARAAAAEGDAGGDAHRSPHWRIPDGDLYQNMSSFFRKQKD